MKNEFEWLPYGVTPKPGEAGIVACAEIYSRNGAWGECFIWQGNDGKYYLTAGGMDTGLSWKSPDDAYETVDAAKEAAEKTWKPVVRGK